MGRILKLHNRERARREGQFSPKLLTEHENILKNISLFLRLTNIFFVK